MLAASLALALHFVKLLNLMKRLQLYSLRMNYRFGMKNHKKMQKYVEEEQSILWTVALRANKINRNEFIELKSMSYLVAYCVLCKKRDCYGFTAILLFQSQKLLGFDEETSMYYTTTHSLFTTLNTHHYYILYYCL